MLIMVFGPARLEIFLELGLLWILPCKPKVTESNVRLVIQEYIRWFDIPMDQIQRMEIVQRTQHIIKYDDDVVLLHKLRPTGNESI